MPWRHMGEWMYRPTFSWPHSSWRWVVSFTPRPLYPRGKSPWFPLDKRLGGPQNWSGRLGEEKILDRIGAQNSNSSVIQPIASRYTNCAILAPNVVICQINILFLLIHTTSNTDVTNLVVHGVLSGTTVLVLQALPSKDAMRFKKSIFKRQ
jgi:hypothetical protein